MHFVVRRSRSLHSCFPSLLVALFICESKWKEVCCLSRVFSNPSLHSQFSGWVYVLICVWVHFLSCGDSVRILVCIHLCACMWALQDTSWRVSDYLLARIGTLKCIQFDSPIYIPLWETNSFNRVHACENVYVSTEVWFNLSTCMISMFFIHEFLICSMVLVRFHGMRLLLVCVLH